MINLSRQIAAIDLGSNSFHMVVARLENNQPQIIDAIKEMVRLAAGLDNRRVISQSKMEEALECLSRFGQRIKDLPRENVTAVGTMTLRRARNSVEFLAKAEKALGFPINIVAGQEEARLVYQGVAHTLVPNESNRLVMDIGGASTEFIIGKDYQPIKMQSLSMGCVSFTRKWFEDGLITKERVQSAIIDARRELEWISEEYLDVGWDEAIGSSGTIKTIARVLTENYQTEGIIEYRNLKQLSTLFIQAGDCNHIVLPGLSEKRAPVIIGGLCVLMAAFKELKINQMVASEGALREGLLYDMIETAQGHDIRDDTVRNFKRRYQVDTAQSARTTNTALHLYDQLEFYQPLSRQLLDWACSLHEVGLSISYNNYPEHSGYIVEQSDMPGFSREIQNMLGLMLRLQRGKFKVALVEGVTRCVDDLVLLIILLRLSIILERSRDWDRARQVKIKLKDKSTLKMKFPEDYLEQHPLTHTDLAQEKQEVAKAGYKLSFK